MNEEHKDPGAVESVNELLSMLEQASSKAIKIGAPKHIYLMLAICRCSVPHIIAELHEAKLLRAKLEIAEQRLTKLAG